MFIACFDFGMKHIGVAIGQFYTKTANPLISLNAKKGIPINWLEIKKIIDIWLIKKVVIGYPIEYNNENNNKIFISYINKFAKILNKKFNLKIFFSNEAYTSYAARNLINNNFDFYNSFYSNYNIHSISAVYILEMWLKKNC